MNSDICLKIEKSMIYIMVKDNSKNQKVGTIKKIISAGPEQYDTPLWGQLGKSGHQPAGQPVGQPASRKTGPGPEAGYRITGQETGNPDRDRKPDTG